MALQIPSYTTTSLAVIPNAIAVIGGFGMTNAPGSAPGSGIRCSVAFYTSPAARASGLQCDSKDYVLPNPVSAAMVQNAVANGTVDVVAVLYAALLADVSDFAGATAIP